MNPTYIDPPFQQDLRKILTPLFSRSFLLQYEPQFRAGAAGLVDGWVDRGEVEFMREFAAPFVGSSLAQIVFNEADHVKMTAASDSATRVAIEGSAEAFLEMAVLAWKTVAERMGNPSIATTC